jgi:hypothetical protein
MAHSEPSASFLAQLEEMMREEFVPGEVSSKDRYPDEIIISTQHETALADLEVLMRQEFFPQPATQLTGRYIYRQLEDRNSIRLLHLEPARRGDPIKGRIFHTSFSTKPEYEALSYTWGSPAMHHKLLTDDGFVPITASLQSALTRLRFRDRTRVLWVDALCINQKDFSEKSDQILLMPKIYSLASKVVVDLGQERDGSGQVIGLLEKIAQSDFAYYSNVRISNLSGLGLPPAGAQPWKSFRAFWRRPWFRRVWIIQEFLLGKDVTVICGEWERDWKFFLELSEKSVLLIYESDPYEDDDELEEARAGSETMQSLCLLRSQIDCGEYLELRFKNLTQPNEKVLQEVKEMKIPGVRAMMSTILETPDGSRFVSEVWDKDTFNANRDFFSLPRADLSMVTFTGMPLLDLISFIAGAQATDPRDHLFALLGLTNDLDDEEIEYLRPNYEKPVEWVVCRYAAVILRKGPFIPILGNILSTPGQPFRTPSWVGDWTSSRMPEKERLLLARYGKEVYQAAGNSVEQVRIGEQEDVLVVLGGLVDTIDRVGMGAIIQAKTGPLFPAVANTVLYECDTIFGTLTSYPTGEPLPEVQWRTLIANKTAQNAIGVKAPPRLGVQYKAWREHIRPMVLAPTPDYRKAMSPVHLLDYFQALTIVSSYKLCKTEGGYVGLVPLSATVGDRISIFSGGIVPFVLRDSIERPDMFRLVGGCYIHGMMNGEALNFPHWQQEDLRLH